MKRQSIKLQKGINLIELMISLALGFIIVTAMIALFINSKQSYRLNDNMSRLQENARFAVQFLSRDLRMADWANCVTEESLHNALTATNNSGLNQSDIITIQWQTNDCTTTSIVQSTVYSLQNGASGRLSLFRAIDGGTAVELVEGISGLQILVGEDTDDDYVPNYFVDPPGLNPENVVAVRFTVEASTLDDTVTINNTPITRDFSSVITLRNRVP
jgi:type IV pilus assembly protein PilW